MTDTTQLAGQIALVTGASRGIGAAIARLLAERGMRVVGTATSERGVHAIDAALSGFAGSRGIVLDVNDAAEADKLVADIAAGEGALHVLVNNAGITRDGLAARMKDEDWDAVIDTDLKSVFRLSRAALRPMMRQHYGRIINLTSVVGAMGNAGQVNYAAAKAGVAGLTRALARELAPRGITVNSIAPGFIETDMTAALSDAQKQALMTQVPLQRFGQPGDIAHAVAYLASPEAGYITGQQLHVNGGLLMP